MKDTVYPLQINEQLRQIENITDRLGMPVDGRIRLLVASLRAYGFVTTDSCEGHEQRRTNGPRVSISSTKAPDLERKLHKLDLDSQDAHDIRREMKFEGLHDRSYLLDLLDDFYGSHQADAWTRLIVEDRDFGGSVLICQGAQVVDALETNARRLEWLALAKAEFDKFAQFMLDRIANGEKIER